MKYGTKEYKEYQRQKYLKNRDEILERQKFNYHRNKGLALGLFYNSCFICAAGSKSRLEFHEKKGENHSTHATYELVLKDPKRFVLLCKRCHRGVHWCMSFLRYGWEEIKHFVGLGNPEFKEDESESYTQNFVSRGKRVRATQCRV